MDANACPVSSSTSAGYPAVASVYANVDALVCADVVDTSGKNGRAAAPNAAVSADATAVHVPPNVACHFSTKGGGH